MKKLETIIAQVLEEIRPEHTVGTFESRKQSLNRFLRFAQKHGFDEPCQELFDAFTADDKGSVDIRFLKTHAVRLVDRVAETHAKDRNGRLYNEPALPSHAEVEQYFADMVFPLSEDVDLNYLIVFSEKILERYDLTVSTIGQYRHAWIDLRRFCLDRATTTYCKSIIMEFVNDARAQYDQGIMKAWKWKINRKASLVLIEIAETGTFNWRHIPHRDLSCGEPKLDKLRDKYLESLRSRNLEINTIDLHDYVFRYGLKHGSISSYDRLTELCTDDVTAIIQGFSDNCTDRSVATIIPILRSILKYLYDECIVRNDYSGMVMSVFVQRNHVVPYISSEDDVIVSKAIEVESLRNKAIILLALKLGLRDIDICTLKMSSIDWINDCLHIPQKKTDVPLCLPMLPDVGNALMEYITKERPLPHDGYPYVFRRKQAPYNRLSSAYPVCSKFIKYNGLRPVNGDSTGVHVLRYTLVNRLLKARVPHQVVTDTLGHTSKESDKPYLTMEADMLRLCALDLSICGVPSWMGGAL